jgi:hypothetical protein
MPEDQVSIFLYQPLEANLCCDRDVTDSESLTSGGYSIVHMDSHSKYSMSILVSQVYQFPSPVGPQQ